MEKILIVDDEKEIVEFLKNFLTRRKNIKVLTATNAKEAIDLFIKERPKLVFLDIRMNLPEDGFVVLKKIREVASEEETKVVMLTAKEDRSAIVKSKRLGAQEYLVKPIDLMVFDKLISHYLEKK